MEKKKVYRLMWSINLLFYLGNLSACKLDKQELSTSSSGDPSLRIQASRESTEESVKNNQQLLLEKEEPNSLILMINGIEYSIILEKNSTTDVLIDVLPQKFSMNDLNNNEKYYELPRTIPTDAVGVEQVEKGDVMLFGTQTLVIFYQSFSTSYSYTRIGSISNVEALTQAMSSSTVEVQKVNERK